MSSQDRQKLERVLFAMRTWFCDEACLHLEAPIHEQHSIGTAEPVIM